MVAWLAKLCTLLVFRLIEKTSWLPVVATYSTCSPFLSVWI